MYAAVFISSILMDLHRRHNSEVTSQGVKREGGDIKGGASTRPFEID